MMEAENQKEQKGLMGLKFMQRARERQLQTAKEEVSKLLNDLGDDDDENEGANAKGVGGWMVNGQVVPLESGDPAPKKNREDKRSSRKSTAMASVVTVTGIGGSDASHNSAMIPEAVPKDSTTTIEVDANTVKTTDPNVNSTGEWRSESTIPSATSNNTAKDGESQGAENPWLKDAQSNNSKKRSRSRKRKSNSSDGNQTAGGESVVNVGAVLSSLLTDENSKEIKVIILYCASELTCFLHPMVPLRILNEITIIDVTSQFCIIISPKGNNANTTSASAKDKEVGGPGKSKKQGKTDAAKSAQNKLVREAFATVDYEADFQEEKERKMQREVDEMFPEEEGLKGWGSWAGEGVKQSRRAALRKEEKTRVLKEKKTKEFDKRRDRKLQNVVLTEKKNKKASKYLVTKVMLLIELYK